MAEAHDWAIDEAGLRLPARRDIARHALVSEATISRRFRASNSDEWRLVSMLVSARDRTYPPSWLERAWPNWVPESDLELQDLRAWICCLAMATKAPPVAESVCAAWERELGVIVRQVGGDTAAGGHGSEEEAEALADAEVVQALLLGLSIKRTLDPELTWDRAVTLLHRVVAALGHDRAV